MKNKYRGYAIELNDLTTPLEARLSLTATPVVDEVSKIVTEAYSSIYKLINEELDSHILRTMGTEDIQRLIKILQEELDERSVGPSERQE